MSALAVLGTPAGSQQLTAVELLHLAPTCDYYNNREEEEEERETGDFKTEFLTGGTAIAPDTCLYTARTRPAGTCPTSLQS